MMNTVKVEILLALLMMSIALVSMGCSSASSEETSLAEEEMIDEEETSEGEYMFPQGGTAHSAPLPYYGSTTMEERVLNSDIIARVRMRSVEPAAADHTYIQDNPYYQSAIKYTFAVTEYLKGSGDDEISVMVLASSEHDARYATEQEALEVGKGLLQIREGARWEDREAIIFAMNYSDGQIKDGYRFSVGGGAPSDIVGYALGNRYNVVWLPAAAAVEEDGIAGASESDPRFLLEAPEETSEIAGASSTGSTEPSTIALSGLRSLIGEVNRLATPKQGVDPEDLKRCLNTKYAYKRQVAQAKENGASLNYRFDFELDSGKLAGTLIHEGSRRATIGKLSREWWEGRDRDLFRTDVKLVPQDAHESGTRVTRYRRVVATRPLPLGEYWAYIEMRPHYYDLCDAYPDELRNTRTMVVTVTAPAGVMHEAFFDPVTIDSAVGADGDDGVLKPVSFTVGSSNVSLNEIAWESGRATMEFEPSASLAGHHADFIGLDGEVSLRLDFDDGTVTTDDDEQTITWNVCDQPWESGDLLMLRISATEGDLTGVTNDQPCSPALTPPPAPEGVTASLSDGAFSVSWTTLTGTARYEVQHQLQGAGDAWTGLTPTQTSPASFTPQGGPKCGATYRFRVRAYGNGTKYEAGWGAESDAVSVETAACNADPEFGASSYDFTVAEDAAVGAVVETVSATDADEGDVVTYSITEGNEEGKFVVGSATGSVTVADTLDYETTMSYSLTVDASDGRGGKATAKVNVKVTDVAEDPPG